MSSASRKSLHWDIAFCALLPSGNGASRAWPRASMRQSRIECDANVYLEVLEMLLKDRRSCDRLSEDPVTIAKRPNDLCVVPAQAGAHTPCR
jgi:hypothetical protein